MVHDADPCMGGRPRAPSVGKGGSGRRMVQVASPSMGGWPRPPLAGEGSLLACPLRLGRHLVSGGGDGSLAGSQSSRAFWKAAVRLNL